MILLYIFDGRNFSKIFDFDTKEIEILYKKDILLFNNVHWKK